MITYAYKVSAEGRPPLRRGTSRRSPLATTRPVDDQRVPAKVSLAARCAGPPPKRKRIVLTTFRALGVRPETADALAAVGITEAFPIQELTLPVSMSGADIIGQAKTGTGKTLGFGIPIVDRVISPMDNAWATFREAGKPQALVVVPTGHPGEL